MAGLLGATGVLVGRFVAGSDAWHAARMPGVTATQIAAVLGLSPFESRFSLWCRKRGLLSGNIDETPLMEWGRRLEPVVLAKYADDHMDARLTSGTKDGRTTVVRHTERPWQLCSPDGVAEPLAVDGGSPRVVEAKIAPLDEKWGTPDPDDIPVYYRAQVLWQLDTLGLREATVAVLIGGWNYREYNVAWNDDECSLMRHEAEEFLRTVRDGERPTIDGHAETYKAVRRLHPKIDGGDIEISATLAMSYENVCAEAKSAEENKRRVVAALADAMGNAERALFMGKEIARRVPNGDHDPYLRPGRDLKGLVAA